MINVSDRDSFVWYINISPLNRYLFIDILKALAVAAVLVIGIQILPMGNTVTTVTTVIIAGLVFWGVALVVKLFTSFTGHSIRFLLDDEGVTAMADEGKIGLSYVARQVSSMRWDPMHAGSMRESNIQPDKTKLLWRNVTGINLDEAQKVIILKKGAIGTLRLYCNEDNFDTVLGIVQERTVKPKQEMA